MSIIDWPVFEQITKLFAFIINAVYNFGSSLGFSTVVFTIVLFVLIAKIIFSPIDILKMRNDVTAKMANKEYQENNGRYSKDAIVFYKTKMLFEKAVINLKYHASATFALKTLVIQLPLILIIYHILGHMNDFIGALGSLSKDELTAAYTMWGYDLREKPGFTIMAILPIMAFVAQTLSGVIMTLLKKEKLTPGIFVSNILTIIIGFRFSSYLSIYWTVQTMVTTIIAVIMFLVYKNKDNEFFINKNLAKLNKSRLKRGLPELSSPIAIPAVLKKEVADNE